MDIDEVEKLYSKHNFIGWTETSAKVRQYIGNRFVSMTFLTFSQDDLMIKDSVKFLVDTMVKNDDHANYSINGSNGVQEDANNKSYRLPTSSTMKDHDSNQSSVCLC